MFLKNCTNDVFTGLIGVTKISFYYEKSIAAGRVRTNHTLKSSQKLYRALYSGV